MPTTDPSPFVSPISFISRAKDRCCSSSCRSAERDSLAVSSSWQAALLRSFTWSSSSLSSCVKASMLMPWPLESAGSCGPTGACSSSSWMRLSTDCCAWFASGRSEDVLCGFEVLLVSSLVSEVGWLMEL